MAKNVSEFIGRKGAPRISEIPADVLRELNAGRIETVNLVEWLAVDSRALVRAVLPGLGLRSAVKPALRQIDGLEKPTQIKAIAAIARGLLEVTDWSDSGPFEKLASHGSDLVRSWAANMIGLRDDLTLRQKLEAVRRFAADPHFGVREEAWYVVRADIAGDVGGAISLLKRWVRDRDENIRRFATESTRPRGVWTNHIEILKTNPEMALPLLDPLHRDSSKYVRDSVANWLNDASKSRPGWVQDVCDDWLRRSGSNETKYIVKRALRTINGSGT